MEELRDLIRSVSPAQLRGWRHWMVVGAFAASIVVPVAPDPVSHLTVALAVVVLYELLIGLVVTARRRERRTPAPEPQPAQQRLPMAIAMPNRAPARRPKPRPRPRRGPATIDLRERQ